MTHADFSNLKCELKAKKMSSLIRQTKKELNIKLYKREQEQVCDFLFNF